MDRGSIEEKYSYLNFFEKCLRLAYICLIDLLALDNA